MSSSLSFDCSLCLLLQYLLAYPLPQEPALSTEELFRGTGADGGVDLSSSHGIPLGHVHFAEQPSGITSVFCKLPSAICSAESPPDMTVGVRPLISPFPLQLRAALYFTIFRQSRSDFLWLFFPALLLAKELKPAGFCPLLPAPFKHSAGAVQVHRKHCCPSLYLHLRVFLAVNKLWIKPRW